MEVANLLIGLAGLSIASDVAVRSARALAEQLRVSTLFLGLTERL